MERDTLEEMLQPYFLMQYIEKSSFKHLMQKNVAIRIAWTLLLD